MDREALHFIQFEIGVWIWKTMNKFNLIFFFLFKSKRASHGSSAAPLLLPIQITETDSGLTGYAVVTTQLSDSYFWA